LVLVNNSAPDLFPKNLAEYEKLFLETLSPVVFGNSKSIGYTPSSTSNGWLQLNFSNPNPITERYNNRSAGSIYGETDL
jgi:beta-mannosidase